MARSMKTAKGRYKSISIPLSEKGMMDDQWREIKDIQRQAIDNFIAHKGVELIPQGQSGNPASLKKRSWGWQKKKTQKD